jgi:hypothetical protein
MAKWRLILTTLPMVLGVLAAKEALRLGLHFDGWVAINDLGTVFAAGAFMIGFMLSGVVGDFKESERVPGTIVGMLYGLETSLKTISRKHPAVAAKNLPAMLPDLSDTILGWLHKRISEDQLWQVYSKVESEIVDASEHVDGALTAHMLNQLGTIGGAISRASYISRTGFIASGYAFLQSITGTILLLLMVAKFPTPAAEMILVPFLALLYIMMFRLIKDLDDPFEYNKNGAGSGSEVDLFPLIEYVQRAKATQASAAVQKAA